MRDIDIEAELRRPEINRDADDLSLFDALPEDRQQGPRSNLRRTVRILDLANAVEQPTPRRSARIKMKKAAVLMLCVTIFVIGISGFGLVKAEKSESSGIKNHNLMQTQPLPGGVLLAKTSTLHHYKYSKEIRFDTHMNFNHLLTQSRIMISNYSDLCDFVQEDQGLVFACYKAKTRISLKLKNIS